jgi:tetratricopeptide (TPR) repeat protein
MPLVGIPPARDVFAIQDEISLTIVDRLKVQLVAGEEARVVKRHTVDPEAHNLYLKGRYLFARRSEGDIARAMACYEQARAQDPEYALPYVGLADALLVLGQWAWLRPVEAFPRAKTELERALALDGNLAEAHASLGYLATIYDWDWERSEQCFARALSLNPRYGLAHHWYAILLCARERFAEAIRESRVYLELEPLSPVANTHAGQILLHAGRTAEAIEQLGKALELDPHMPIAHVWLELAYLVAGRFQDALDTSANVSRIMGRIGSTWELQALARAGRTEEARRAMANLEQGEKSGYVGHLAFAFAHAALRETEPAVQRLERAFEERHPQLPFVKILHLGPEWVAVLADARVQALMRKMGLPE